jgi:ABC-2 type transport system permease protein
MKYLIAEKAPIIGYINPPSLITDIFYSLYYYDEYTRIYINLCILIVLTIIFGGITYLKIRRRQYASI